MDRKFSFSQKWVSPCHHILNPAIHKNKNRILSFFWTISSKNPVLTMSNLVSSVPFKNRIPEQWIQIRSSRSVGVEPSNPPIARKIKVRMESENISLLFWWELAFYGRTIQKDLKWQPLEIKRNRTLKPKIERIRIEKPFVSGTKHL